MGASESRVMQHLEDARANLIDRGKAQFRNRPLGGDRLPKPEEGGPAPLEVTLGWEIPSGGRRAEGDWSGGTGRADGREGQRETGAEAGIGPRRERSQADPQIKNRFNLPYVHLGAIRLRIGWPLWKDSDRGAFAFDGQIWRCSISRTRI